MEMNNKVHTYYNSCNLEKSNNIKRHHIKYPNISTCDSRKREVIAYASFLRGDMVIPGFMNKGSRVCALHIILGMITNKYVFIS